MRNIRIGSGAGYGGDRIEPAIELIKHGKLDYIIFETLAERTIALSQKERAKKPNLGYNPLLCERFQKIFDVYGEQSPTIITNMGAANPISAVKKVKELAEAKGLKNLKIAAVIGDDISDIIENYYDDITLETEDYLVEYADKILSANAYTGCSGIVEALKNGADIIITGRVSDPSLTVGPLVYEFNKSMADYDFLGKATVAGHLLECASQVCGGYFADPDYKEVPDLWNVGFPIAEIAENGNIEISKLANTGGIINTSTVTEQLLYEIQDPSKYYTPDVIADLSQAVVKEVGPNKVQITNLTGHKKTGMLKVSVGYRESYLSESEISYGGSTCLKRAKLAEEVLKKRFSLLDKTFDEMRFDLIGLNSLYKDKLSHKIIHHSSMNRSEVRLRVAAKSHDKELAKRVGIEVEALYTNGPAGGGGVRNHLTDIVSVVSILVPERDITQHIVWEEV